MPAASFWLRLHLLMRQRIPTLIGIIVLVVGVVAGVLLVGEGSGGFLPRASEEATPQQVRITNITDTSFSVSFTTINSVTGSVQFGTSANDYDREALDDRDQLSGQATAHRTHHITVRNLQPSSQYFFRLRTQGRHYFDNQGNPFSVSTGPAIDEQTDVISAQGEVLNQAGNPASNSLVYLTSSGASPLSAYVKQDGSWSLPLRQMRTKELVSPFNLSDDTALRMQIVSPDGQQNLEFAFRYNQLDQISSLQFGQEPNLTARNIADNETNDVITEDTSDKELNLPSKNSLEGYLSDEERSTTQIIDGVTINFPREENEVVTSTKPELSGQAPPGSTMQIQVHSSEAYYGVVEAEDDGSWQWSPPDDLEPGEHAVTLTYTGENGVQQQITRTFIVQADGTYPSFEATPSGNLANNPTPIPTIAPTPTTTPLVTPTPTPIPATPPVTSVTPRPSATPVPGSQPVSGDSTFLWLMMGGASFLIGMGVVWKIGRPAKKTREWYK